ncbi:dephospho-CoA kinase [Aquibacillus kalidii]|uniref:dephospho-CoA kinase n=1 Tax=Aquibacillus kalidii TaxID=2762597 RepID=UPI001648AF61|nr:dephospho-CoA kinase [Aquibacillus kalidii]
MAIIIGLTGSIASGKSTVAKMFSGFNIPVVDADIIAREVVEVGRTAYQQVVKEFGESILNEDKTINRKHLGKIVFSDERSRKKLNSIVHPAVREEMIRQKQDYVDQGNKAVVLDIPLLFESKLTYLVDKTVVIYVDEKIQLKRLMERDDSTIQDATSRIRSQIPVKQKAEWADAVIDNSYTIESSGNQLVQILKRWNVLDNS